MWMRRLLISLLWGDFQCYLRIRLLGFATQPTLYVGWVDV
jgi:hypothetical protein